MSLPALRQPKSDKSPIEDTSMKKPLDNDKKLVFERVNHVGVNYVILTLKDGRKLVVNSDAYHGIIAEAEMYRCVFCGTEMVTSTKFKELHKKSSKHQGMMNAVPYIDGFSGELLRKLNKDNTYCTICNVVLPTYSAARHITTDAHMEEKDKASQRGSTYKPEFS